MEERLKTRGELKIESRLKAAKQELDFVTKNDEFFDKIITNDDLKKSFQEFEKTMLNWGGFDVEN